MELYQKAVKVLYRLNQHGAEMERVGMSIKNKEIIKLAQEIKNEISCVNCKYCNHRAYYGGKWYCDNPYIKIGKAAEIEKCFVRKENEDGK